MECRNPLAVGIRSSFHEPSWLKPDATRQVRDYREDQNSCSLHELTRQALEQLDQMYGASGLVARAASGDGFEAWTAPWTSPSALYPAPDYGWGPGGDLRRASECERLFPFGYRTLTMPPELPSPAGGGKSCPLRWKLLLMPYRTRTTPF